LKESLALTGPTGFRLLMPPEFRLGLVKVSRACKLRGALRHSTASARKANREHYPPEVHFDSSVGFSGRLLTTP
jgi:hypothetical protein